MARSRRPPSVELNMVVFSLASLNGWTDLVAYEWTSHPFIHRDDLPPPPKCCRVVADSCQMTVARQISESWMLISMSHKIRSSDHWDECYFMGFMLDEWRYTSIWWFPLSPFWSRGELDSLHRFLNVFRVFVVVVYSFFIVDVRHSSSNFV